MTIQINSGLWRNLETGSIIFFIFCFMGVSLPSPFPSTSIINIASYAVLVPLFLWQGKRLLYVITRDIPLLLLLAITAASIFWSASPDFSFNEIKAFLRSSVLGAYLATRYTLKEQIRIIGWILTISVLLSLAIAIAMPAIGTHGASLASPWKGIYPYKNTLARIMSLAAMFYLLTAIDSRRQRWLALGGFCLALILVLCSQGKTSYVVFLILLCLLPLSIIFRQHYKLQIALYSIFVLLAGLVVTWSALNLETIVVKGLGKDLSFNGRTDIWILAIEKGLQRPWLGYGYVGFWTSDAGLFIVNNTWASTEENSDAGFRFNCHNHFIDLFLQVGGLGMLMYIISYLMVFTRVIGLLSLTKDLKFLWMLQFVVSQTLFNLADSATLLNPDGSWTIYISIALSTAIHYERTRRKILELNHSHG